MRQLTSGSDMAEITMDLLGEHYTDKLAELDSPSIRKVQKHRKVAFQSPARFHSSHVMHCHHELAEDDDWHYTHRCGKASDPHMHVHESVEDTDYFCLNSEVEAFPCYCGKYKLCIHCAGRRVTDRQTALEDME